MDIASDKSVIKPLSNKRERKLKLVVSYFETGIRTCVGKSW